MWHEAKVANASEKATPKSEWVRAEKSKSNMRRQSSIVGAFIVAAVVVVFAAKSTAMAGVGIAMTHFHFQATYKRCCSIYKYVSNNCELLWSWREAIGWTVKRRKLCGGTFSVRLVYLFSCSSTLLHARPWWW